MHQPVVSQKQVFGEKQVYEWIQKFSRDETTATFMPLQSLILFFNIHGPKRVVLDVLGLRRY